MAVTSCHESPLTENACTVPLCRSYCCKCFGNLASSPLQANPFDSKEIKKPPSPSKDNSKQFHTQCIHMEMSSETGELLHTHSLEHIYQYTHWANPHAPIVQIMKTIRLCSLTHTVIRTCYPHPYLQLLVPRPWLHQPQKAVVVPISFQVQFEDAANFVE
jgi:hypothetical protein